MSLITDNPDDSPRHCATKHHHHHAGRGQRRLLVAASSAAASLLALCIILWLTLRPSSPRFMLLAATATASNGSIARLEAVFVAHNPNARAAALYDRLQLRASYGAGAGGVSQLTATPLPPFEQTQGDVMLSASLASTTSAPATMAETQTEGGQSTTTTTLLRLRVEGQLRWKVAAWVSSRRALAAECVAVVMLQPSLSLLGRAVVVQGTQCATTLQ